MATAEEPEPAVLNSANKKKLLIIEGIRENGTKFRPSDWPERISSTFAGFGKDQRLHYAPGVSPRVHNGQKVLAIEAALKEQNPVIYQAVIKFARENNLRIREEAITSE
jgi:hypothetical protein